MDIRAFKTHYRIDGKKYDRITSVLDYFTTKEMMDWALTIGKEERERIKTEAISTGKKVDEVAQAIMGGHPYDIANEGQAVKNCVEGFKRWLNEEKPKISDWQVTLVDNEFGVAGTYDIRAGNTIIDIKCSNRISPNYWLQTAMYAKILENPPVAHIAILRLDKLTSDYEYVVKPIDYKLVDIYKGLLDYYRYIKGVENEDANGKE